MSDEELNGRLAAIEAVIGLALNSVGTQWAASAWPNHLQTQLNFSKAALLPTFEDQVTKDAAEAALDRMFAASVSGFRRPGS